MNAAFGSRAARSEYLRLGTGAAIGCFIEVEGRLVDSGVLPGEFPFDCHAPGQVGDGCGDV